MCPGTLEMREKGTWAGQCIPRRLLFDLQGKSACVWACARTFLMSWIPNVPLSSNLLTGLKTMPYRREGVRYETAGLDWATLPPRCGILSA